jgi:very-short-patch-repair endonuclease
MRRDLEHAVVEAAARHDGILSRRQLLELGLTRRVVDRWASGRRLQRVHRGVYLVGAVMPAWAAERAALLACGPRAVLGHWSAARANGQPAGSAPDVQVHVIIPVGSSARHEGVRPYRTSRLHASEVHRVHGLRVTTPARTLLDLAGWFARRRDGRGMERVVAATLNERLATVGAVRQVMQRHRSQRGAGLLRKILGIDGGAQMTRSDVEARLLAELRASAVPAPELNVRVCGFEVDFLWRQQFLAVEVDGYAWHSSRSRFESDRDRDAALAAAGYTVLRFTWRRITREPVTVATRIAYMLGRLSTR